MSTREEYLDKLNDRMKKLDAQIDALEGKARAAKVDVEISAKEALTKARVKRDELRSRFSAAKQGGDSAWEEMKRGLDSAWSELSSACERAKERFSATAGQ